MVVLLNAIACCSSPLLATCYSNECICVLCVKLQSLMDRSKGNASHIELVHITPESSEVARTVFCKASKTLHHASIDCCLRLYLYSSTHPVVPVADLVLINHLCSPGMVVFVQVVEWSLAREPWLG
jgi:hypothetical protein